MCSSAKARLGEGHYSRQHRRDGKPGTAYLVINNSLTDATEVELPCDADRYTLSADTLRSPVMRLNGRELVLEGEHGLPDLSPVRENAGTVRLAPATATFFVL